MVKRVANGFFVLFTVFFVLVALSLGAIRLFGGQVYTVLSGSMEPTYKVGSLLVVMPKDYKELKVGDPITFVLAKDLVVTHRIVEIIKDTSDEEALWFNTKGDNNNSVDASPVYYKNIIGCPVLTIPFLGYLISFMKVPPGSYLTIGLIVVLLVIGLLPMFKRRG